VGTKTERGASRTPPGMRLKFQKKREEIKMKKSLLALARIE
jgi:hypothetical protein